LRKRIGKFAALAPLAPRSDYAFASRIAVRIARLKADVEVEVEVERHSKPQKQFDDRICWYYNPAIAQ